MSTGPPTRSDPAKLHSVAKLDAKERALFTGVRETIRAKLRPECGHFPSDGEVFEAMLECALLAWTLRDPRARTPNAVVEREGWRCAVPGCTSRRNLHDHHLRFRSAGGSDAPENRVALCAGAPPLIRYRSGDIALPEGGLPYAGISTASRLSPP